MRKIIFFGTPNFAVPILDRIIKNDLEIICVFTQPPKRSNRGQKILKSPVHNYAEKFNLKIKTPENIKKEENFIKTAEFDLGIVVAYGQIIPKKILDLQEKVWGYSSNLETHTVETHIYRLRQKIKNQFNDENFIKHTKEGYSL